MDLRARDLVRQDWGDCWRFCRGDGVEVVAWSGVAEASGRRRVVSLSGRRAILRTRVVMLPCRRTDKEV